MPIIGSIGSQNTKSFLNPNAPTIGTATNIGTSRAYNNGSATVTFTAAATGAAATSFTATSSPGSYTATGSSSPLTLTGLQSGTTYTFVVKATNAVGDSANSSASNSITATTVPQAPTIGSATGGNASATVAYTAGATGGAAVSTFTATSSPGSLTGTGASPITVSGLSNGTAYTFTVTATNANGTSTASSASNSVTPIQPGVFNSLISTNIQGFASVTITSIPSGYKHLVLRTVNKSSGESTTYARVNSSANNVYLQNIFFNNSTSFNTRTTNDNSPVKITSGNFPSSSVTYYTNYASTNIWKPMQTYNGGVDTGQRSGVGMTTEVSTTLSAITSLQYNISSGTMSGTTINLYGIS